MTLVSSASQTHTLRSSACSTELVRNGSQLSDSFLVAVEIQPVPVLQVIAGTHHRALDPIHEQSYSQTQSYNTTRNLAIALSCWLFLAVLCVSYFGTMPPQIFHRIPLVVCTTHRSLLVHTLARSHRISLAGRLWRSYGDPWLSTAKSASRSRRRSWLAQAALRVSVTRKKTPAIERPLGEGESRTVSPTCRQAALLTGRCCSRGER